uniref:Glutamine--fructose-6-phosphate aminotransferase [isomerizing] n=1 Tax=viral metagenome TaxID=1070528 RepID=A0A6C0HZR6_9ZZZZ
MRSDTNNKMSNKNMCGIVAYLGNEPFVKFIINGLHFLLNRGYDSVGISTILDDKITTIKEASSTTYNSLELVEKEVLTHNFVSTIGIGHTRWATHGGKTRENAHPHSDNSGRISLVHNGIIENYTELKSILAKKGYKFQSQTDTEVIAVLIGSGLDTGLTMPEAFQQAISQLRGTWALVAIHKDFPNHMWITRNGSPLLLGMEDTCVMVASESIAFGNHIEKYVVLENHDIIEIHCSNVGAITYSDNIHTYAVKTKVAIEIETKPAEYAHWMQKEIMEQSAAAVRAMNNKGRITTSGKIKLGGLEKMHEKLAEIKHLIILGCGTSYNAGLWSCDLFKKTGVFDTVTIYDGAEFCEKDVPKRGEVAAIFLSQSGETKDLHRCIELAKSRGILKIGVVNVVDSMIARETDCGVYLNAGREVAVASTKSFTNQCIVLAMISIWFSQLHFSNTENRLQDLYNLPFHLQNTLNHLSDIQEFIDGWHKKSTVFLLGKGPQEAIAKEGSLKIKEIAYIHAEGYSSSALKHGAFALIDEGLPIVLLDIGDEYRDKNQNAYSEIMARGADVLLISDSCICQQKYLSVDHNPTFGGVIANIYLQWISYLLALEKGNNPDYPRNLAKVVTVE